MKTIRNVPAGEELFNDYGPLPRSELLLRYGYVTDRYEQYDIVIFPMEDCLKAADIESGEPPEALVSRTHPVIPPDRKLTHSLARILRIYRLRRRSPHSLPLHRSRCPPLIRPLARIPRLDSSPPDTTFRTQRPSQIQEMAQPRLLSCRGAIPL